MLEWGPARIPQTPVSFTQRITIEGEGTRPESLEIAVSFRVYEPINSFRLTLARRFTEAPPYSRLTLSCHFCFSNLQ
jgi:hypothetical protein